jgi:hypothetical protein
VANTMRVTDALMASSAAISRRILPTVSSIK